MGHALWCAAHVTEAEAAEGRTPGRCSCRGGTPRCERTVEMFEEKRGSKFRQLAERAGDPPDSMMAVDASEPIGQSLEEFVAETPEEVRREADLTMLRELFAEEPYDPDPEAHGWGDRNSNRDRLFDDEHEAFGDMLARLEDGQRVLTNKQREWAERRAKELGLDCVCPAPDNSSVPRGREVELAVAAMPKPLKPPGRR